MLNGGVREKKEKSTISGGEKREPDEFRSAFLFTKLQVVFFIRWGEVAEIVGFETFFDSAGFFSSVCLMPKEIEGETSLPSKGVSGIPRGEIEVCSANRGVL